MGVLYSLQYLDKTTLSYAASMGIMKDNNLSSWQYAWSGSMFYIGYLVFAYPHNRLLQRFPLGKYLAVSVMTWGVVLACTAVTSNAAGVFVTRFFLGACEGAVTAGSPSSVLSLCARGLTFGQDLFCSQRIFTGSENKRCEPPSGIQ